MTRNRSKAMLDRTERLPHPEQPAVIIIVGCPQGARLFPGRMKSEREMVVGEEHFDAMPEEATKDFERRMAALARERRVRVISQGAKPLSEPQRYPRGRPDASTLN